MSLYEQQKAKAQRTKDFTTFWGSGSTQGTATQTDVVQTLLKSGTSGNLETYLKEHDIDVHNVPQNWNKPVKQVELRDYLATTDASAGIPQQYYKSPTTNQITIAPIEVDTSYITEQVQRVVETPNYNLIHEQTPLTDPFESSNVLVDNQTANETGRMTPTTTPTKEPEKKDRTKTIILLGAAAVLILILFVGMRRKR